MEQGDTFRKAAFNPFQGRKELFLVKTLLALPEKSVLLVEDSTLTRFSSRRTLEEKGYLVDEAASGQEALSA
ncbi:FOG: CheY-like receiver [Moorella thermoacetica Y72]|uniref:Stage 0 sporulation protein A homolog n=1 Tax=Moorella thermoacetica Y72 TaxID=1325331 RepID=A0A0S6UAG3_NEOTH|nr:FOG: CheY-like receiver [Moorella thermoacetica Y72]